MNPNPTKAILANPKNVALVWMGRSRPNVNHSPAPNSGALNLYAINSPTPVANSSQRVAVTT